MCAEIMLVVAAAAAAALGHADGRPTTGLAAGRPVDLCLAAGEPGFADYASGRRKAVLVVHEVTGDGGPITVTADTGEETSIGLFPGGPFAAADPAEARRFFLPGGTGTRCWTVTLSQGGSAAVALEISDPLD